MAVPESPFGPTGLPVSAPALRALGAMLREVDFDGHGAARAVGAPAPSSWRATPRGTPSARTAPAADTVWHWLRAADVVDVTVTGHDSPLLQVASRPLEQRRLHGNSLLVYGAGRARRLLDSPARRGVVTAEFVTSVSARC